MTISRHAGQSTEEISRIETIVVVKKIQFKSSSMASREALVEVLCTRDKKMNAADIEGLMMSR